MGNNCLVHEAISISRHSAVTIIFLFCSLVNLGQCPDKKTAEIITKTENDSSLTSKNKLDFFYKLKKQADSCKATEDSIYIRILENISGIEFQQKNYATGLSYALLCSQLN